MTCHDLSEWRTLFLKGESLVTEGDRSLADTLARQKRAVIEEMRDGVRIKALSWIGVIRFTRFEVRIRPKLAGGDASVARLIDYTGGLDTLARLVGEPALQLEGHSLLDLVALLFTGAVRRVAQRGLLTDYRGFEEDLPVVRGRMLAERQMRRRFGRIERLECRFDDRTTDIVENRVLAAALGILSRRVHSPAIARDVRRLQAIFSAECNSADRHEIALARNELTYHRLNAYYESSHRLAWLIFDAFGIEEMLAPGSDRAFAFLVDMNRVFERFCERWIRNVLLGTPWEVHAQAQRRSVLWDAHAGESWGKVRPDLLIAPRTGPGTPLPVDAKYKLYDERPLDPADLYQLFLYAVAFAPSEARRPPTALILFPASDIAGGERERVQIRRITDRHVGAEVLSAAIPIALALAQVGKSTAPIVADFRTFLSEFLMSEPASTSVPDKFTSM